jgi:hypothetical protein
MKTIILTLLACVSGWIDTVGQGAVVIGGFRNTDLVVQDDIISMATFADPVGGTTSQNGLLVTSDFFPFFFSADTVTATGDLEKIEGLQVFPNPTPDILVIQREEVEEDFSIEIFDINGVLLHSYTWPMGVGTYQPSFQAFAPGPYFISIMNQDKTRGNQYKIIKH